MPRRMRSSVTDAFGREADLGEKTWKAKSDDPFRFRFTRISERYQKFPKMN